MVERRDDRMYEKGARKSGFYRVIHLAPIPDSAIAPAGYCFVQVVGPVAVVGAGLGTGTGEPVITQEAVSV